MFLGGLPFLLFVAAIRKRRLNELVKDAQVRGFSYLFLVSSLIIAAWLVIRDGYAVLDALRVSMFNIVSVVTTTGFGLEDFTAWGALPTTLFAFLMMAGACSGSTAGGIKIFRFQIALTLLNKQMMKLIHPSGVFVQRYNQRPVNDDIVRSVVAFGLTFFYHHYCDCWWPQRYGTRPNNQHLRLYYCGCQCWTGYGVSHRPDG